MLNKVLEIMFEVLWWVFTLIYFMVIFPIGMVLQGLYTPIGIIIYCIVSKRYITPGEYFELFASALIDGFGSWLEILRY